VSIQRDVPPKDWTTDDPERVPRWRRADRDRVEAARALGGEAAADPVDAAARAQEIHRLVDLHRDGVLTSGEFLAAVRVCLERRSL
jgi:hypothetical protein